MEVVGYQSNRNCVELLVCTNFWRKEQRRKIKKKHQKEDERKSQICGISHCRQIKFRPELLILHNCNPRRKELSYNMSSPVRSLSSSPKTNGYYTNGVSPITNGCTQAHNGLEGNDISKGWIIQKFGGTSVGKFAKTIVRDIVK